MNIVSFIQSHEDFIGGDGCSQQLIQAAEKQLGAIFAEEYKEYLMKIGLACFNGHELTGIGNIDRLDVVVVTKEQRNLDATVPQGFYVVEKTNIDGVVYWQDVSGIVYVGIPGCVIKKAYESLVEYVQHL